QLTFNVVTSLERHCVIRVVESQKSTAPQKLSMSDEVICQVNVIVDAETGWWKSSKSKEWSLGTQ
ncbi:1312_t:CDS:2, partial [Acaulospora colombiana]